MQLNPDDKRVLVVSIIRALTAVLQDNKQAQVSHNHLLNDLITT